MPKQRPRELIKPHHGDSRYVRRNELGQFTTDQVDVGRSLAKDRQQHAAATVKPGYGDRGDQARRHVK